MAQIGPMIELFGHPLDGFAGFGHESEACV
jgi:hypothetical protein